MGETLGHFITELLSFDWLQCTAWQGIAGIAQVVAVCFAVYAAWQARDASKQAQVEVEQGRKLIDEAVALVRVADAQRLLLVEPDWEVVKGPGHTKLRPMGGDHRAHLQLALKNTGFGPARSPQVSIVPKAQISVDVRNERTLRGDASVVLQDECLYASVRWPDINRLVGTLCVTCESRLGTVVVREFKMNIGNDPKAEDWEIVPIGRGSG